MYGGQAVIEGVMMRSPRFYAVACRKRSTGELLVRLENVETMMARWQWLNKPFLRGTLALIDAMAMGIRSLTYAANIQAEDELESEGKPSSQADGLAQAAAATVTSATSVARSEPAQVKALSATVSRTPSQSINGIAIGATLVVSFAIAVGLFWVVPTLITQVVQNYAHIRYANAQQSILLNLGDGLIRIVFFLAYLGLISRMPHVQRVFQYHGAEHKAINTLEAGEEVTLENARKSSRIHPRCGTNFIFIVLIVGIIVASFFGRPQPLIRVPLHLLLLPVVAGISFEILKFAGSHRDKKWAQALIAPGLKLQYLTTRVPADDQIEVAIAALQAVWAKEHETASAPPTSSQVAAAVA